jgi:hypothetical protein
MTVYKRATIINQTKTHRYQNQKKLSNDTSRTLTLHAPIIHVPHAARTAAKAWRQVQRRVAVEEVTRSQHQRHRLGGHDGEVLGGGKVHESKGVPENDVGVGDALLRVGGDPFGKAAAGRAACLRDVAAGGVDLVVGVCVVLA